MKEDNFMKYAKQFVKHVKPSKEKPVPLLLDNHDSHISTEALDYFKSCLSSKTRHISCVGIPSDVLKIIRTPGLFWYCPTCSQQKKDFDRVFIKIDDKVDTLIADVYNIFSEAKGHLINKVDETLEQTVSQRVPGPSASYANTLKKTVNVIVTPKNNDQSHSATRLRISQSVDPVDNNIRFSQVKNVKNGGILIKCDGSDDANKLKDLASRHLSADYEVKEVRKFNPRLKIVGMSQCIEKEELCTMLKSQNNAFHAENQITTITPSPTRCLRTECESRSLFDETFNSVFEPELRENLKTPEDVHSTEANVHPSLHNLNLFSTSSATFEELRHVPKAAPLLENRRNIQKRKIAIYTDTSEKLNLLDMKNKRETNMKKKTDAKDRIEKGKVKVKGKGKGNGKGMDKVDEIVDDTVDENDGNGVDSDDESTICLECTESHVDSVRGEQWIQCLTYNYTTSLWLSPLLKDIFRWTRDSDFVKVNWKYFEAERGKGAADGIGGFIKRTADQFVAIGKDISDASSFYQLLKDSSNVKMYLILEHFENMGREYPTEIVYNAVYGSDSESSDDQPGLSKEKDDDNKLIEKENIHPSRIEEGVDVLVKICSSKNEYIYLGKALNGVDDDEEVKIVFMKSVDHTGKTFKLVENDIPYEQYESLIRIVSEPKNIMKRKRVYSPLL
ncbi:unnamed protein product [Acanthoscelides obtectus]|uniref:DDE-1 domain-containing protein n=1 Tax=Acanthoscelides obtectus TaxID=200917 RepID=A0A9P0LQY9_ACAOB|nr:unnamed protein product [Acanthoscelides obtectus]CAK1675728.1 hypothetical protein AOBTE_LOCUS30394 [Acanthoscelides obtectus]